MSVSIFRVFSEFLGEYAFQQGVHEHFAGLGFVFGGHHLGGQILERIP